jgi:regulator of protease activity HflC (stomatin/prohibitin superfamily)
MFGQIIIALIIASGFIFSKTEGVYTTIPEGYVGVYKWLGQVQPNLITSATLFNPLFSTVELVKYIEDPDEVNNVKCVSKEGVDITIKSIQIANKINPDSVINTVKLYGTNYDKKIVTDPLEQKMREVCAEMTVDELEITRFKELDDILKQDIQNQITAKNLDITVTWVRITGIIVPPEIKAKRLALASEKAEKILVEERNKRLTTEKLHEETIARKNAEIELQKAKASNEIRLENAHAERKMKTIEFETLVKEGEARAQKIRLEASALQDMDKLVNYYRLEEMKALADGSKLIYWGNSLPSTVIGSDVFGSVLNNKQ